MSDPSYFDTPDSPPPPAYEFCQQEFDQKVSHALEASEAEQHRVSNAQEDEWEVWDEEAFLAAAARLAISDNTTSPGASSSRAPPDSAPMPVAPTSQPDPSPGSGNGKARLEYGTVAEGSPGLGEHRTVQPLRIVKKSTQTPYAQSGKEKERPSWLEEAQLDGPPLPQTIAHRAVPLVAEVRRSDSLRSMSSTPPPEFTPVGPSLDGPPYEDAPQPSGVVLTYVPGDSRPASPLHSPVAAEAPLPHRSISPSQFSPPQSYNTRRSLPPPPSPRSFSSSPGPQNRGNHYSLPTPPRTTPQATPRPVNGYNSKTSYAIPRVTFDPRVAYANEKSSYFDMAHQEPPPAKVDAAALYSSAVSSLYANVPPPPPLPRPSNVVSSANTGPYQSRSAYHLPQGTAPAASTYSLHSYPNRERPPSPTPSVMSSTSQHTTHSQYSTLRPGYQPQQNSYRPGTVYQSTTYQNQSQPTYQTQASYSRPRYQSTSYQSPYQPTSF